MRKKFITPVSKLSALDDQNWLDLEQLAEVELTSEDDDYPIEFALLSANDKGWRAASPGKQVIRLVFSQPQHLRHINLHFIENHAERTQQYTLRWSADSGQSFQEIVRQQWTFSPGGATSETEDHQVDIEPVTVLELEIIPDISGGDAVATLAHMRLA